MVATYVTDKRLAGSREFGRYLERARSRAGLTQEELAARLSVTQSFVGRVLRGERRPDAEVMADWADALGLWLPELLHEAGILPSTEGLPRPSSEEAAMRVWNALSPARRQILRVVLEALPDGMLEQVPEEPPAAEQIPQKKPQRKREE